MGDCALCGVRLPVSRARLIISSDYNLLLSDNNLEPDEHVRLYECMLFLRKKEAQPRHEKAPGKLSRKKQI